MKGEHQRIDIQGQAGAIYGQRRKPMPAIEVIDSLPTAYSHVIKKPPKKKRGRPRNPEPAITYKANHWSDCESCLEFYNGFKNQTTAAGGLLEVRALHDGHD